MTGSRRYKLSFSFLFCVLLLQLSGCTGTLPLFTENPPVAHVVETSHAAADALIKSAGINLDKKKHIIAATFVNIDDLEQAAPLGRIVSRQVASQFTQQGFKVIEVLFRHDVFITQNGGEFMLSRELRNISLEHDAQAVIVGTYGMGRKTVYITARLIRAADSIVLASYDYTLPMDKDITFLLQNK